MRPEDTAHKIKKILFRNKEQDFLLNFFGSSSCMTFPFLFVQGNSSTGKTLLLSDLLNKHSLPHVWINCYELCSAQLMLSSIVEQIYAFEFFKGIFLKERVGSNICEVIDFLQSNLADVEETVYFVFDNAEILRKDQFSFLSPLLRIQEITKLNICIILISEIIWEKFRDCSGLFDPIILYFPDYTKEQLIEILCLDCPVNYSEDFYKNYVSVILKVFYIVTRNIRELRHLAKLNFSKYCEPVHSGNISEDNVFKLWRNIEPTLKEAIHAVYLRETSGFKWNLTLKEKSTNLENSEQIAEYSKASSFHMTKELPFYSKFLLIASYFASYNLPRTDYKHFVKNQGKQKKKKKVVRKSEKNRHLFGPRAFTLDRMLSIFFSIVGNAVLPSALIFSQVSSLVSLQLISRVSMEEQLNCPKYKCLAELDLVRNIGKTVNVDVMSYLDDFI